jgi:predicted Zn-dependent protease
MATARCAMSLNQEETAVAAILLLRREFPHDLRVLYFTTHYFSELASRASQELVATAPASPQARELDAEAFESEGKWDEAAADYNLILKQSPQEPGIHYRLGRILLAKPATPTTNDEARKELEAEIRIDPSNASAEFTLGEIARQAGQWDAAIPHFVRASQLDDGFLEAYLALGISLNSAGKFSDAVAPLEKYVKMEPSDPAGHYQLATAYSRTGRKEQAAREMVLQGEARDQSKNPPSERTAPH